MLFTRDGSVLPASATASHASTSETENSVEARDIADIVNIIEAPEAENYVGDLFRRKFGGNPPDFPKHFIALYSADGKVWQAVAYVNFWARGSAFMGGGLVIEDRAYRSMPKAHRKLIKSHGGLAQIVLGTGLKMLPPNNVVWGYVADTRAERVDMQVGFEHTHLEHIIAHWSRPHSDEEKHALTEEVRQVGHF